ncbi:MAG: YbhB/YbcL family Raf kinase inhibitor-like protein [Thermoanaerobaculia bacterium]
MEVTSRAFEAGGAMPARLTCDGGELSPPLAWSGAPPGTGAFALIVEDPDAPSGTWVHWVVYDLPGDAGSLAEDAARGLPSGAREGTNSWGAVAYGGPCPPSGSHRYVHRLFALDAPLGDLGRPTARELERAIRPHLLARGELVGTYRRLERSSQ